MAVVREFTLPDLGEGLAEAEIVRWLVRVGEVVGVDQPLVEVETAKAVVEVPCPYGGVVTARFGEEGDTLGVGRPLVTVAVGSPPEEPGGGADGAGEGSGSVLVGYGTAAAAGRRRQRLRAAGAGSGTGEHAGKAEASAADGAGTGNGPVAVVSPLVRRLAREHGVDLRTLAGSGPEGLILRADVERAVAAGRPPARPERAEPPERHEPPAEVPDGAERPERLAEVPEGAERVPLRGVRAAAAAKLARSRREIPDATCWVDADATALLAARAAMNASGQRHISLPALLARIATAALARHPDLNAVVDAARREVVRLPAVHLGFAAQTERGLMVPVVRDAHTLSTQELSAEMDRLTRAARAGKLTPAELTGGTFTLNNYGVFGVDGSTPIINHPEAAMLGVGRIAPKPWVHDGGLAVRQVVQLSLTFDHRVCDGAVAGGFLRAVADCVEEPAVLLAAL